MSNQVATPSVSDAWAGRRVNVTVDNTLDGWQQGTLFRSKISGDALLLLDDGNLVHLSDQHAYKGFVDEWLEQRTLRVFPKRTEKGI